MSETANQVIKSSQEQAVAAWVTYLNQVRLDELVEKLNQQDINLEEALKMRSSVFLVTQHIFWAIPPQSMARSQSICR